MNVDINISKICESIRKQMEALYPDATEILVDSNKIKFRQDIRPSDFGDGMVGYKVIDKAKINIDIRIEYPRKD